MQNNQSFLDKNTIIATILILFIWFGWGHFVQPSPSTIKQEEQVSTSDTKPALNVSVENENRGIEQQANSELSVVREIKEETLAYESDTIKFLVSSRGMGLKDITIKTHTDRNGDKIHFYDGNETYSFETRINDKRINFSIEKTSATEIIGSFENEEMRVKKIYNIDSEKYNIQSSIEVTNKLRQEIKVENFIVDLTQEEPEQSIFNPSFERQELFVVAKNKPEREMFYLGNPVQDSFSQVAIAALSSHYFTKAIIDYSELIPSLTSIFQNDSKETYARLTYPSSKKDRIDIIYKAYIGPKKSDIVSAVDPRFTEVVDYGFFSGIAKPILRLLVFLFDIFNNYGVAIIILTVLVRVAVLPFNVMSYRSMKKMQVIQPIIQKIREKHKEDPMKMNQEVMAVMKENKANPMGGCLPMLLQLPIFFALYQVLGQSIELYQAPFMWWINDLSLKDPFYVLPVLMGITMYLQQKFTPMAIDPTQAKVMMFLPVVFSLMMVALPSGLTLYIFISTLFAVIQQKILMKTV